MITFLLGMVAGAWAFAAVAMLSIKWDKAVLLEAEKISAKLRAADETE